MGESKDPVKRRAATHMLHAMLQMKAAIEARVQAATGYLLADNEALLNLSIASEPIRMTDLANRLVLSKGGTTKVVDRLEERGLVMRTPDASDRRALLVEITDEGLRTLAEIRPIVDGAIEEFWSSHLTDDEAAELLSYADRVNAANPDWYA